MFWTNLFILLLLPCFAVVVITSIVLLIEDFCDLINWKKNKKYRGSEDWWEN